MPAPRLLAAGFTLIELIIVMVLVSLLAFAVIPRLNTQSLQAMPVAEQIAAEIRYAQNLAMTRSDAHTFSVGGGSFSISNSSGTVPLSNGKAGGTYNGLGVSAASITFSPRFGQPDSAPAIVVSGGGVSVTVLVEGETGYVRIEQ